MARRLADEHRLDFDELLAGGRRLAAECSRLQALGLRPREFNRRMLAWIANDVGVDADELEDQFVVELERMRKGTQ